MSQNPPPPPYPGDADGKGAQSYGAPYPPQAGYPEPQGGYPPSQGGYPPSQGGYPPPQGGYYPPPQPGNYPPQGYPQQPGYPPNQGYNAGQHSTTVVVAQPPITLVQTFNAVPVRTSCPHCRADIVTATHFESGTFSWVVCVILCLVGCDLGCCLIPFCVEGCQDVIHTCPNCRQQIARWNRM